MVWNNGACIHCALIKSNIIWNRLAQRYSKIIHFDSSVSGWGSGICSLNKCLKILILGPATCNLSRESCRKNTQQSRNCFKDVFLCAVVAFSPLPLRIWHLYENWSFTYYQLSLLHWNKLSAFSVVPVQAWRKIHNSFLFLGYAKLGRRI